MSGSITVVQAIQLAGFGVVDDIAKQFEAIDIADDIARETLRLLILRLQRAGIGEPMRDYCNNMVTQFPNGVGNVSGVYTPK